MTYEHHIVDQLELTGPTGTIAYAEDEYGTWMSKDASGRWLDVYVELDTALCEIKRLRAVLTRLRATLTELAAPMDCGCVPCTGQCRSREALEVEVDGMKETAREAFQEARPT